MTYLSIIEKLRILFDMLLDFKFILIFMALFLVLTIIYMLKKISSRKYAIMMFCSFILLFAVSIISNYKILADTFDNFTTIFFTNIYFPSIYVYIGTLVISFIVFVVSLFNVMIKKIYKVINGLFFVLNNILFVIVLNIIAKNRIDIFSISSLYTSTNLVAILEISMSLFILWLLSLIVVYATNIIYFRISYKKVNKNEVLVVDNNDTLSVDNLVLDDVKVDNGLSLDGNMVITTSSDNFDSFDEPIEREVSIIDNITPNTLVVDNDFITNENDVKTEDNKAVTFDDILNGRVPVTYYNNDVCNDLSCNIIDPQAMYEEKYNNVKRETSFQDIIQDIENVSFDNFKEDLINTFDDEKMEEIISKVTPSAEDKMMEDKKRTSEERLLVNTVSLNDLAIEDISMDTPVLEEEKHEEIVKDQKKNDNNYTIDDYKKFMRMLNSLKSYSNNSNISVDDAIAISLINNYSIDDCVMFKEILESGLV